MVSIPGALVNFSNGIFSTLKTLGGLQDAVGDPIAQTQARVSSTLSGKISGTGSFFQDVPGFVNEGVSSAMETLTSLDVVNLEDIQQVVKSYSAGLISEQDLSLAPPNETTALSKVFAISKSTTTQSLFQDPLQSFFQVNLVVTETLDTLKALKDILTRTSASITNLLNLQPGLDYNTIAQVDQNFFATGSVKANTVFGLVQVASRTLAQTGQIIPAERNAICTAIDDAISYFALANTKLIEFEQARAQLESDLDFLRKRFAKFGTNSETLKNYIPTFVASAVAGKLFRAASDALFEVSSLSLEDVIEDINFVQGLQGKRREKILSIIRYTQVFGALKALLCTTGATEEFASGSNPNPDIVALEGDAAAIGTELTSVGLEATAASILAQSKTVVDATQLATIEDNSATLVPLLTGFQALITTAVGQVDLLLSSSGSMAAYQESMGTQLEATPDAQHGPDEVLNKPGLDGMKSQVQKEDFDTYLDFNVTQASQLGQFSDALSQEIKETPEGPDQDQLLFAKEVIDSSLQGVLESLEFDRLEAEAFDERVQFLDQVQRQVFDSVARGVTIPEGLEDLFDE